MKLSLHSLSARRTALAALSLGLVGLILAGACQTSLGIPSLSSSSFAHGIDGIPKSEQAHLWVSYQIAVESIDGTATNFRAPESCLYYQVSLPAGEHELEVRLDFANATHKLRTDVPLVLPLRLEKGAAYRLIDLDAGNANERSFKPWLLDGAPVSETLEVSR